MVDVIFDSNIYGIIIDKKEKGLELADKIAKDENFIIHNFILIRKELRGAPKILPVYDRLVSKKIIQETKEIQRLADSYFKEYKNNKGVQGKKKIINDFKIVACATLGNFDLIASEDKRTMQNPRAIKAYKDINLKIGRRTPTFYTYNDLVKRYV